MPSTRISRNPNFEHHEGAVNVSDPAQWVTSGKYKILKIYDPQYQEEFTRNDPDRLKAAQEFRREVDRRFNFGGARSADPDAAIPIAWEDRKEAGFTDEELAELADLSGEGPSRKTLRAAADILVARHRERKGLPSLSEVQL